MAIDWDSVGERAVDDLRTLLRFETVNPPGDEAEAGEWVVQRLAEEGIETEVRASDGRPNVVARIEGDGSGGGPLLLAGHLDVVPVELEHWTCDPFAAEVRDGYLFGRGAIDMKFFVVMSMYCAILARRSGRKPTRDLIFAAVSDEEEGCHHGSKFLVENHPDLVRAEYMLGEGGGFSMDINGVRYYPIRVAEKGTCRLKLTARGEPGHGSIPIAENAVVRLGRALAALGGQRLPQHNTDAVISQLATLGETQPAPQKWVLPLLLKPRAAGLILDNLFPDPSVANAFAANLSNTVSPTMLAAGTKINVVPGSAEAMLDGRLIPGQTADDMVREVRAVIGPDIDIEVLHWTPGLEERPEGPLWELICDKVVEHDPGGTPLPTLLPGFTDAQYFARLGASCIGFAPVRFPVEDEISFSKLFHGHDERIHVDGYRWGLRLLWDVVSTFVGLS